MCMGGDVVWVVAYGVDVDLSAKGVYGGGCGEDEDMSTSALARELSAFLGCTVSGSEGSECSMFWDVSMRGCCGGCQTNSASAEFSQVGRGWVEGRGGAGVGSLFFGVFAVSEGDDRACDVGCEGAVRSNTSSGNGMGSSSGGPPFATSLMLSAELAGWA